MNDELKVGQVWGDVMCAAILLAVAALIVLGPQPRTDPVNHPNAVPLQGKTLSVIKRSIE